MDPCQLKDPILEVTVGHWCCSEADLVCGTLVSGGYGVVRRGSLHRN
jgi:hypothetical protein